MYNYKLQIQYDGGRYDGWQRMGNDSSSNTIEAKIKEIISKMTGEDIDIYVGCRTEKGVHALAQTANFKLNDKYQPVEIKNYLNRYLPRDIAVNRVEAVDERFHSQLNAREKTYVYRLDMANVADVFTRKYAYHTFDVPDIAAMRTAAQYYVGSHDFKAFTTARKSKSTVRNVKSVDIEVTGDKCEIRITADDFLHNMARYMIGMLLDVGSGLKKTADIEAALEGRDVVMSLPAESYGLFLESVLY